MSRPKPDPADLMLEMLDRIQDACNSVLEREHDVPPSFSIAVHLSVAASLIRALRSRYFPGEPLPDPLPDLVKLIDQIVLDIAASRAVTPDPPPHTH